MGLAQMELYIEKTGVVEPKELRPPQDKYIGGHLCQQELRPLAPVEIVVRPLDPMASAASAAVAGAADGVAKVRRPGVDMDAQLANREVQLAVRPPSVVAQRRGSSMLAITLPQTRWLLSNGNPDERLPPGKGDAEAAAAAFKKKNRTLGDDALSTILSALYAKLLVVVGIAMPITEVLSAEVHANYFQGFYLYLYVGSILYMCFIYMILLKSRAIYKIINRFGQPEDKYEHARRRSLSAAHVARYGSFYLRLGATAFGIGSMVYSGLEFGQFFELNDDTNCANVLQAVTPAARMLLTLLQMQFIFMNSKDLKLNEYRVVSRLGLMHMTATNLCEWLYVLVEETKHEIVHLAMHGDHHGEALSLSDHHVYEHPSSATHRNLTAGHNVSRRSAEHDIFECRRSNIMGSLVQNAAPFLFPCTIEYSLICAVVMYEMWKHIQPAGGRSAKDAYRKTSRQPHRLSVDCAKAHKGLFGGIFVVVLTIISLILFFVLHKDDDYREAAEQQVTISEISLYVICSVATVICMLQLRELRYYRTLPEPLAVGHHGGSGLGLDNTLLLIAQSGMFLYCTFSVVGCAFESSPLRLATEVAGLFQTVLQTVCVLDGSRRRCRSGDQARRKPGRELLTFLLVANAAMWLVNVLHKGHAEFRPQHLSFFGIWAWAIITHVSMPLAIFYRFHSTICIFEVWKSAYKVKHVS
ncbi:proton channel OtopLc-like [Schistocerca cancellata]|uniref:proton channel OtopLc-like n=1 Tax=Schistocerca cancellata TaxID=274614 RepID=UPI002117EF82|nr:proton channel OtopLc-like [Schistocerca cancellata]